MRSTWLRLLAVLLAFGLIAAACGDDDDDDGGTTTTDSADDGASDDGAADSADDEATDDGATDTASDGATDGATGDGATLVIGAVQPETGALGPLGVPIIEGAQLAVEDIQAAGGKIEYMLEDSGTDPDVASQAVDRLLSSGANVIFGAAASGVTGAFLQVLSDGEIPSCSASATSPSLSDAENADYFIRTVPPDEAVAPVIADEVVADGGTRVAIVARADDYGNALAQLVASNLTDLGVESNITQYDPEASSFEGTVEAVDAFGPDKIVNIGFFFDGTSVIRELIEAGYSPEDMYGSDGLFLPSLPADMGDANLLDGMKLIGASGGEAFNARLTDITNGNLIYGGQAYDCIVLLTLAFEQAGSTDGPAILEALNGLTQDGEVCTTYADCSALIAEGTDIDYEGQSGVLNLDEVGDPTFGRYAIAQFQDGELTNVGSVDIDLA
ncbi:MAG: ABC transporter substrate-binding protein, partial [Acidimicrobiales bacterium]|nr:ABC transporter substrate-binding protein [Acidimicrobiales bacterium]